MKRYLTWLCKTNRQIKFKNAGIGLVAKGNKAVYDYMLDGVSYQRIKYETPGVCTYEIDDSKITQHRILTDRLSIAKQAAKATIQKWVVNSARARALLVRQVLNTFQEAKDMNFKPDFQISQISEITRFLKLVRYNV